MVDEAFCVVLTVKKTNVEDEWESGRMSAH
jgi:hypothetical protein